MRRLVSVVVAGMLVLGVGSPGCSDDVSPALDGSVGDGQPPSDSADIEGLQGTDGPSGDGSTPIQVTCEADATSSERHDDPNVMQSVTGTNGTFSDTCDAQGDLVQYVCEVETVCGPGPNPACETKLTGKVVEENVDCNGGCAGGACDGRCPAYGQQLTYLSVDADGNVTLENSVDQRKYDCVLLVEGTSYDCKRAPFVGEKGRVASLGLHGTYCTGDDFGNIGVAIEGVQLPSGQIQHCSYGCSIAN
jgi:hypothetical protein